jgi:hypothetical protein
MPNDKRTSKETMVTTPPPKRNTKPSAVPTPGDESTEQEPIMTPLPVFEISKLENHPNWIGKVEGYIWKSRTSAFHDLVNSQGKVLTVLFFGRITGSRVGLYGDFNDIYHQSLLSPGIRNLTWKIGPPNGYADAFLRQYTSLRLIEDPLDKDMEPSQRAARTANDIEMKRKIAKKVDSTTPMAPVDTIYDFWKKYKVLTLERRTLDFV